jgi:hypothetical protein
MIQVHDRPEGRSGTAKSTLEVVHIVRDLTGSPQAQPYCKPLIPSHPALLRHNRLPTPKRFLLSGIQSRILYLKRLNAHVHKARHNGLTEWLSAKRAELAPNAKGSGVRCAYWLLLSGYGCMLSADDLCLDHSAITSCSASIEVITFPICRISLTSQCPTMLY